MKTSVKPIPEGYHTLTPYLAIRGAAEAIEFYKRAFGARERARMPGPDGKSIGHAEVLIGDSIIMLADEVPQFGNRSPQTLNGTPITFALYVEDADASFKRAVDAGAKVLRPIADQFYGDRAGTVVDPYGYQWSLMTRKEEVSLEELNKRMKEFYARMAAGQKPSAK
jgi:PhnB protein